MPYTIGAKGRGADAARPAGPDQPAFIKGEAGMGRLIKVAASLLVLGFVALTGYAYLADLSPVPRQISVPVTLHAD
jgi:hypothetical protein